MVLNQIPVDTLRRKAEETGQLVTDVARTVSANISFERGQHDAFFALKYACTMEIFDEAIADYCQ